MDACNKWWANVGRAMDPEMLEIDSMVGSLQFGSRRLKQRAFEIRRAIAGVECCHFKALHRIERIVHAINDKQLNFPGKSVGESAHLNGDWLSMWHVVLDYLETWALDGDAGAPGAGQAGINVIPVSQLNGILGEKNEVKRQRVGLLAEYLRRRVDSWFDTAIPYKKRRKLEDVLNDEYRSAIKTSFASIAVPTGTQAGSFADLLMENFCISSLDYINDLLSLLAVIGGQMKGTRFKGCGIHRDEDRRALEPLMAKLQKWLRISPGEIRGDKGLMELFGERTPVKQWLLSSLEKTIRAQTTVT